MPEPEPGWTTSPTATRPTRLKRRGADPLTGWLTRVGPIVVALKGQPFISGSFGQLSKGLPASMHVDESNSDLSIGSEQLASSCKGSHFCATARTRSFPGPAQISVTVIFDLGAVNFATVN